MLFLEFILDFQIVCSLLEDVHLYHVEALALLDLQFLCLLVYRNLEIDSSKVKWVDRIHEG